LSPTDDPDVTKFLILFERLRTVIDDDPVGLEELATTDDKLRTLCIDLGDIALRLSRAEDEAGFIAPVNPKYISAWRDYGDRYSSAIAGIWLGLIGFDFGAQPPQTEQEKLQNRWENADYQAKENSSAIERSLRIVSDDEFLDEDFRLVFDSALDDWKGLARVGFSLQGVFRRAELLPTFLIPRHISKSYGEKAALYKLLRQAQGAFIFGVPYASVALMRAILELVLAKHYGVNARSKDGKPPNLLDYINDAKLPNSVTPSRLHRLRQLANNLLHNKVADSVGENVSEMDVLSWLLTIRAIIENAPETTGLRQRGGHG
jgi:hypothetical protein